MDDVARLLLIIAAMCFCMVASHRIASLQFQQQAFDRGFMVECVGKSGYYWECE